MYAFCIHTSSCSNTIADSSVADCDRLISSSWCCISASRLQLVLLEDWDGAMFKTPNHLRCFSPLCVYSMLFLLPMYILYIYTHHWLSMSIYIDGRMYMHRFEYASICLYTQHALTLYIYIHTYIYIYVYSFCLHTLALMESGMYESVELRICLFFVFFQSMHRLTILFEKTTWSEGVNLEKPNRNDERTDWGDCNW